jgi:hypothetical protein
MTHKFKAGDVVLYGQSHTAEAIIDRVDDYNPAPFVLLAWRGRPGGDWFCAEGRLALESMCPHPNADEVWADFVKWQLTK